MEVSAKGVGSNMKFLNYILFILVTLNIYGTDCNEISYLDHCLDRSEPDPFPAEGEKSSGTIIMSKSPENGTWYHPSMNCSVIFTTQANNFLLLTFSNISLRDSSMDSLIVDIGKSSVVLPGQKVCSNENCDGLKFESGKYNLTLKFLSSNVTVPQNVTGFRAHYTVYELADKNGACKGSNKFLCDNGHCIWNKLQCDGHHNCEDRSDETNCVIPVQETIWGIVVIVIAIFVVLIFVPVFCCLATFGTRNPVRSVTVSNQLPTPLLPTADCGETSGLLTSSDMVTRYWPGTSYDTSNSFSYGTSQQAEPSASNDEKRFRSMSAACEQQGAKFL